MDDDTSQLVTNSHLLVQAMGFWPSFHDANLLSAVRGRDTCRALAHVHEPTSEVDANGYSVLRGHHLVTLEMLGVSECTLPRDFDGDVLDHLAAVRLGELIDVRFESVIDPDRCWHVICQEVAIRDVVPCGPHGEL